MESVVMKLSSVCEGGACQSEESQSEPATVRNMSNAHYKGMGNLLKMKSSRSTEEEDDDERVD